MNRLYAVKTTGTVFGTKKMIVLFLIISLALLSEPAYANQISTIDELTTEYNSESCIECHKDTHNGWKNSRHGKSVIDPRVLRTWRTFILSGLDKSEGSRRDLKDICLPCHAPQTKDASDDLITSIAGMIITAVEEKDTYETELEAAPSAVDDEIPFSGPADDITITDIKDKDEFEVEYKLTVPDYVLPDSPWIRDEVDEAKDMTLKALEESESNFIEDKGLDESADYNTTTEPVEGKVLIKGEIMVKDEDTALEPDEDSTVSFVEDGEILLEPMEDMTIEVEDMTATIVVEDGKVKIEYSPYNPADDLKEPAFLDKGETLGEKAIEKLSKLNINCVICHSMKALPGGNPRPKTIYSTGSSGSVEHKESLGAETSISGFMKTSEFCAQCHHGCPPGMPSSICPTLWTSYKESYIARGGKKTCQNCHMNGADKKNHSFPGIYEKNQLKRGIQLTLDAEPTRYVYHLENRIVPAVVINVKVKNTAGHSIPHGCTYIPQTALQVSVTDQNGNEIFFKNKTYRVYSLHLSHNREGYLGLNDWDITAMERLNMGIEPGDTDSQTFVATLNEDTTSIVVEASFKYIYEKGVSTVIQKEIKKIEFKIEKKSPKM
ncbi:MAG TPA: hypothetical protein ENG88_03500 [Nitrospirae bacterium]|nr:hypothetical protein [Nitrospirota bacterium]